MTVEIGAEKKELEAERVLVAAGRAPNVEDMGLKEAGVQLTERGFVKVDTKTYETTAKGISELVMLLSGNEGHLSTDSRARAETALATLITKYGYTRESARDLVGALASMRYRT